MREHDSKPMPELASGRRGFLTSIPLVAVAVAVPASVSATMPQAPTREEMHRYYAFLWSEHRRVAAYLDCDVFDHDVVHQFGSMDQVKAMMTLPVDTSAQRVIACLAGCAT